MNSQEFYAIEKILGHKRGKISSKRGEELLLNVKWAGYDESTWEPFQNMKEDCPPKVVAYLETRDLVLTEKGGPTSETLIKKSKAIEKRNLRNGSVEAGETVDR